MSTWHQNEIQEVFLRPGEMGGSGCSSLHTLGGAQVCRSRASPAPAARYREGATSAHRRQLDPGWWMSQLGKDILTGKHRLWTPHLVRHKTYMLSSRNIYSFCRKLHNNIAPYLDTFKMLQLTGAQLSESNPIFSMFLSSEIPFQQSSETTVFVLILIAPLVRRDFFHFYYISKRENLHSIT